MAGLAGSGRVVLSGCSGGGKSSLLAELARRGYSTVPEAGRQIVREQLAQGGSALPWSEPERFVMAATARTVQLYRAAKEHEAFIFFDRALIDLIAFLEQLRLPVPPDLKQMERDCVYAKDVFIVPPWREIFAADPERRKSFDEAIAEYGVLCALYGRCGYKLHVLPHASVTARADLVERACASR